MDENKNQKLIVLGGILFIFVIMIVMNCIRYGFKAGLIIFINNLGKYILYIVIILLAVGLFYFLFKYEKKINPTNETMRNIIDECKINRPNKKLLKNLYCGGDINHHSIKIGKILGYSRRQNFKLVNLNVEEQEKGNDDEKKKMIEIKAKEIAERLGLDEYQIEKYLEKESNKDDIEHYRLLYKQEEDIFYIRKILKKIIVRCPPSLHTKLLGNVYLDAIGLVKHSVYYYPNSKHLDFDFIDNTIYHEGERYTQLWFVDCIVTLLRKASGMSKDEQREATTGKTGMQMVKEAKRG